MPRPLSLWACVMVALSACVAFFNEAKVRQSYESRARCSKTFRRRRLRIWL